MVRTRVLALLSSLAILGILGPGCAAPAQQPGPAPQSGGALADKQVLRVRFFDDPTGFDPATLFRVETENIAFNIYSGLVTYDKSGAIVPDLAENWETKDQRTWTFNLRKGIEWQKGYGKLTAEDVLYSYNRILNPNTASPYRGEFKNVDSLQAPDAGKVVITLKAPDANFLHQVANYHQGQVLKKEAVEKFGDQYKWNAVGTGPFALESFTPSSEIVLVRHEGYFRGKPTLERILFRIIKDDDTGAVALQNGEVDLAMRISPNETLKRLEADGRFNMHRGLTGQALHMFNPDVKPLSDVRVRRAFAHAIDREAIIKATNPLTDKKVINLVPDFMDVYTDNVPRYDYNPERAKQLLAEAGYPNGFTVRALGVAATGVTEDQQLEQSYLAKVGIKLEYDLVDTPTFTRRRNTGEFQIASRLLPAMSPDTILFSFLHPDNAAPKGLNGARYNNPELTQNLEAARAEGDPQRRKQRYADVQRIAMTDLPYLPTFQRFYVFPTYKWVDGVAINPMSQVMYYGMKILAH